MDDDNMILSDVNPEFIAFKRHIKEWLELDDDCRKLREAVNSRNKRKKELEPMITQFMNRNGVDNINTNNGKLKCKTGNYKKPLSQKNLHSTLTKFFNDMSKAQAATEYLINNRETVERTKLSRQIDKKKKNNDVTLS